MAKDLTFNKDAQTKLMAGVNKLAEAVGSTLGPQGRTVVIENEFTGPSITKDGVSVAKAVELEDPVENMGAMMIKEASTKTNDEAGDGTTTSTILAHSILSKGHQKIDEGANPVEITRGINKEVEKIVQYLQSIATPVEDNDSIRDVGTISANNDSMIGAIIAEAMEKVGRDGVITVETGKTAETELEVVEGLKFMQGYSSPYFITNRDKMTAELENPLILLYDGKIGTMKSIVPFLETSVETARPILIIAEDVAGEALSTLVMNKVRGAVNVATVKAPGFGAKRYDLLEDIGILIGGTVVSERAGLKLEDVGRIKLGTAEKVVITKDSTTIVNGRGEKSAIEARINELKGQIEVSGNSAYEKEKLQERLAKLTGGVAVIRLGAESELEMKEKKDRVDDALNATKAAVEEGIVPGGGVALLNYFTDTPADFDNDDQKAGADIVHNAIRTPFTIMMRNAGIEDVDSILNELDSYDSLCMGYDIRNGNVVDMVEAGIIDPVKVTRIALQKAASVAGTMLTTSCVITNIPSDNEDQAMQMPMM